MRTLLTRTRFWLLGVMSGGSLLALDACDATVRDTVLSGIGSAATGLATTFIQAFIESLASEPEDTATTVRAIIDCAQQFFA